MCKSEDLPDVSTQVGDLRDYGDMSVEIFPPRAEVLTTTDYYPFGSIVHQAQLPGINKPRYGYQGEFAEDETEETGWNSFELRQYDSKIGRVLSVDTAGEFPSPYLWVGNNPINSTDPSGVSSEPVHKPWVQEMTNGDTFAEFPIKFTIFEYERGQDG